MSLYAGRKRNLKMTLVRANRILRLSEPALVGDRCAECGGKFANSSPMTVDHLADCRGVKRWHEIYREFMEALEARPSRRKL